MKQRTPKKKGKLSPLAYSERTYRSRVSSAELISSYVRVEETDLHILTSEAAQVRASDLTLQARLLIQQYIVRNPRFGTSLQPITYDDSAPQLIRKMMKAATVAGVGPMAAVAGGVAGYVGSGLVESGIGEVIVENGGDIYVQRSVDSTIAIFAGESPLSYTVGIRIAQEKFPCGVCTSSGTVGHSLSLGVADSVTVISRSIELADAAATRLGNEVAELGDAKKAIKHTLETAETIDGVEGVIIICGEVMGASGDVELVGLQ